MTMAAGKDLKSILTKLQYSDDAKVVQQITAQMKQVQARMAGVKQKLVVMSGKGGVGIGWWLFPGSAHVHSNHGGRLNQCSDHLCHPLIVDTECFARRHDDQSRIDEEPGDFSVPTHPLGGKGRVGRGQVRIQSLQQILAFQQVGMPAIGDQQRLDSSSQKRLACLG